MLSVGNLTMPLHLFSKEEKLDFSDVLLVPQTGLGSAPSSRESVDLKVDGRVPLIVANMDYVGTFDVARHLLKHRMMVALLKDYSVSDWEENVKESGLDPSLLVPTVGVRGFEQEIEKVEALFEKFPSLPFVSLDVPNAYLDKVLKRVREFKKRLPRVNLSAGNVVSVDGLRALADAGADLVKVGVGSGGVCLTRKMTGFGYPQFSAILDLSENAKQLGVKLISDGGITNPGDVMKAYVAGASYVMAGSYFAGHEETGLIFHGMSSHRSRTDRGEQAEEYRASEGREVVLKNKGSLEKTLRELLGGLRSSCTYLGIGRLEQIHQVDVGYIKVRRQLNAIQGVDSTQHS